MKKDLLATNKKDVHHMTLGKIANISV